MTSTENNQTKTLQEFINAAEKKIADWEETVGWIEGGWDCEDEYLNDLYCRHGIWKLLNETSHALPSDLQKRLDAADERYRASTVDDWPFASCYRSMKDVDREINWYWYRRPEEASLRKAWETSQEFRALVLATNPEFKKQFDHE